MSVTADTKVVITTLQRANARINERFRALVARTAQDIENEIRSEYQRWNVTGDLAAGVRQQVRDDGLGCIVRSRARDAHFLEYGTVAHRQTFKGAGRGQMLKRRAGGLAPETVIREGQPARPIVARAAARHRAEFNRMVERIVEEELAR